MILWKIGNGIVGKLSWKGLWVVCRPTSCSKQAQLCNPPRSLRALSSWVSEVSKDGDCTNLPGPQSHWLAVFMRKTFLYLSNQSLSLQLIVSCPPTMHPCEQTGSLSSVAPVLIHSCWGLLLGLPKLSVLQAEPAPVPQPLTTGQVLQPLTSLAGFCWSRSSLSLIKGPHTGHTIWVWSDRCWVEEIIPSLGPLSTVLDAVGLLYYL